MFFEFVFKRIFSWRSSDFPSADIPRDRLESVLRDRANSEASYHRGWVRHMADKAFVRGRCWVVDGDTIRIGRTRIRLAGIDAPEMDQPWGEAAKWALHRMCKRQIITVEVCGTDVHGRLVGVCYLPDGRDLAAEMVRQGLALDWWYFSKGKYLPLEPAGARQKLWRQDHLQARLQAKYQSVIAEKASA